MNRIAIFGFAIIAIVATSASAFDLAITKQIGGTSTINLQKDERVVNVEWKENNLWILTKEDSSTSPSVYKFKEHSNFGVLQGTVIIIEK